MDGGEITREDLKTELLGNWDEGVLQGVGKRCGVEIPEDLSKEEAVERLLDEAPIEKLLEQLLQWELTGGDTESDKDAEAAAIEAASMIEGDAPGAAAGDADEMPTGPDPDDPTLSRVEQDAADALSMLDVEIQSTIEGPDTELSTIQEPGSDSEKDAEPPVPATEGAEDAVGPEDVPREALEAELQANWAADEVRNLAGHFSIEVEGRGKDEIVTALLDEVSRTVLIQEMLAREGGGGAEEAAEVPSAVPVPVPVPVPSAVPEPEPAPEPAPEPRSEPGSKPAPEREKEPIAKPEPSYDDSNLLRELRSMRRETDYQDEEFDVEEDGGAGPLVKMGLAAAVIVGGVFFMTSGEPPRPKPRPTPSPTSPATKLAVDPSAATTGTVDPDGVAAGTATTDAADPTGSTTPAVTPAATPDATPVATPTAAPEGTPGATPAPATPGVTPTASAVAPSTNPSEAPPPSGVPAASASPEPSAPAGPPDAVSLQKQAVQALEGGDLGRAIFNGIRALERGGADWSAREELQKLVSKASFELGSRAFRQSETDKALVELRRAIEYHPDNGDAHFTLGRCYERLKEYGLAIESYSEAVRARPDDGRAYAYLAYAYRAKKMYSEAEHHAALAKKHGETLDPGFLFLLRYRPTPKPGR